MPDKSLSTAINLVSFDSVLNQTGRFAPINLNTTYHTASSTSAFSELNNSQSYWLNSNEIGSKQSTNLINTHTHGSGLFPQYTNPLQLSQTYYIAAIPSSPDIATVNSNTYLPAITTWLILMILLGCLYTIRRKFKLKA